jgi:hypothetical protein
MQISGHVEAKGAHGSVTKQAQAVHDHAAGRGAVPLLAFVPFVLHAVPQRHHVMQKGRQKSPQPGLLQRRLSHREPQQRQQHDEETVKRPDGPRPRKIGDFLVVLHGPPYFLKTPEQGGEHLMGVRVAAADEEGDASHEVCE